ncbi:hypothetical protein SAY87_030261 [Trapa incisa]|uniref:MSP domain-containing protein n=1 Tax=Trapa incisa TaxID=236973 RepID=A0AAN7QJP4_9MYRT|nr:hypothetical protein SAY87_030261 [Trapa incisa]
MASQVLPPAVISIPRNLQQRVPKLGFSTVVSSRSSHFASSSGFPLFRISSSSMGFQRRSIAVASRRRSFVARAESGDEAEPVPEGSAVGGVEALIAEEAPEVEAETGAEKAADEAKPPWKPRVKLGDIMGILNKRAIEASEQERPVPDLRTGDIVEIKLEVPENRRRLSIYKGIIISKQNAGIHTTIRIRRIIAGVGVEIVFPVYSPNIKEIKVVSHRKSCSFERAHFSCIVTMCTIYLLDHLEMAEANFQFELIIESDSGSLQSLLTMSNTSQQLISVHPEDLKFIFELEKQCFCDLKVVNNTEHHVAFKVKTTTPKKYFVRPNANVIQPWDACFIRVTLQPQHEYPPDLQCKDKFLLQSTIVPPHSDIDDLSPGTFNNDEGKLVEECKLKVVYIAPNSVSADAIMNSNADISSNQAVRRAKEERDAVIRHTKQLQQELNMLKKRMQKSNSGFSFKFSVFVALIGLMAGLLLNLSLSSTSSE